MTFRPRVAPRYTCTRAAKGMASAPARKAPIPSWIRLGETSARARGSASANTTAPTSTLETVEITEARVTMARTRLRSPCPMSMATRRTDAMSIPNREKYPRTKAPCVAKVTMPKAAGPWNLVIRTWVPKVARMATTSPMALCPVPARMVRSSPKRSNGRTDSSAPRSPPRWEGLFEVAKAAEVLLHLQGFLGVEVLPRGDLAGSLLFGGPHRGLLAHEPRQHPAVVVHRGRHLQGGEDGRGHVHQEGRLVEGVLPHAGAGGGDDPVHPVVAGEPVGRLHHGPGVGQAVALRRFQDDVRSRLREPAAEHVLSAKDLGGHAAARVRILEGGQRVHDLVPGDLELRRVHGALGFPPRQVDGDPFSRRAHRRVGHRLLPVHGLGQGHPSMEAQLVVDLAGHGPHAAPLHRPEDGPAGLPEPQEAEVLQQAVHVDGPGAGLEPVVRDEQDEVLVPRSLQDLAEPLVQQAIDVADPLGQWLPGELGVVRMVRGHVL